MAGKFQYIVQLATHWPSMPMRASVSSVAPNERPPEPDFTPKPVQSFDLERSVKNTMRRYPKILARLGE
jgi:hypothetical protein